MQTKEPKSNKVRLFSVAKELTLETPVVIEYCKELGYAGIKNQLSTLEPEQVEAIKARAKAGPPKSQVAAAPAKPTAAKPTIPPPAALTTKVRTIAAPPKPVAKPVVPEPEPEPEPVAEAPAPVPEPVLEPVPEPVAEAPAPEPAVEAAAPSAPSVNLAAIANAAKKPMNLGVRPPANKPVITPPRPAPPAATTPPAAKAAAPAAPSAPAAPTAPAPAAPAAQGPVTPPPAVPPRPVPTMVPPRSSSMPPRLHGSTPRPPQGGSRPSGPPQQGQGPRPGPGQPPPRHGAGPQGRPGGSGGPGSHGGPPRPGPARPATPPAPKGQVKLTPEQIARLRDLSQRGQRINSNVIQNVLDQPAPGKAPDGAKPGESRPRPGDDKGGPPRPGGPPGRGRAEEEDDKKVKRPGEVSGRESRARGRQTSGRDRKADTDRSAVIIGAGGSVEMIEQQTGSRRGPRAALINKMKRRQQQQVVKKEGPVEIAEPITVRALSEAIGMKTGELGKRLLKETNQLYGNNSVVAFDVAELIAIEKGITLVLKKQATAESKLLEAYEKRAQEVDPELLQPRPPVVTIMGHVDHGKTSLLDKIRQQFGVASDVVSTEAGGITQVIRAWQVAKDEKRITFLDTPGHEAFTKMRARGAKVTDIVVIVVAATDGVMPQTEEAINHAKAADVDIIVAINKIDMPNANIDKTKRQLYSLGLLPDDMGGDIPFLETSAVTGAGISELLEAILLVAELADLKADPSHPASGTCLEAYQDSDEGVKATLIVQQGTLHKGDVVLCGATFGRVRMMYNDLGQVVEEAGPSTPVKITGLDEVPDADDPFYAVEDVGTAREIAEKRKVALRGAGLNTFAPVSLENLADVRKRAKITELKVILKAEARGSVEAIRKELEKLVHDEVKCRVLHAGIGAITESDVILALTSPDDTMVIGFNVTADDAALKLAENRNVAIREFDIIYKLTDAVKSALEGKLKPVEEVVHLGRASVRETFKISKVGTIAGCFVTSGTIERSARVRIIRNGVVIYPTGERVVGLDNLKRFKDDVKEVREGFECGMKITGFDDIKVDDVIEAFKIEVKQRTL